MPNAAFISIFSRLWRSCCGLSLALIVLVTPAFAQETGDGFADGDVLKITAFGREDLTGQYSVQRGPLLSLPLIGTVKLDNSTPRQLETELAKAWENRLGSPMSVTVEYAQRAPFYVLGAVNAPGAYPYRSGLTVLQAVAVSGGIEKTLKGNDNLRIDLIHERERRLQAIEALARATARKARLLAERDGKEQFTLDPPFSLLPQDQMDTIISEESRLLDSRARQDALKQKLMSGRIKLGEAEVVSYQRQLDSMNSQRGQIAKEVARIRRVPGQQARAFELDQRATSLETTRASIAASISRAKVEIETARNGIADLQEARQREISEALQEAEQTIRENEVTVASTQEVLDAVGGVDGGQVLTFKLMRNGRDDVAGVMSTTLLRPGDLLEVGVAAQHPQLSSNP